MSAAVRIIAPRMSPDASGCRAIASTAWPPMRPMPSPTPITARPSPRPAPSSALAFLAAAAMSAPLGWPPWSSVTRSTMVSSSRVCCNSPRASCDCLMRVLHHADEHRCEQRKDIGLQERHQQLQQHHERHERHRARRHQPAAEDENQAEQREDHEMPRRHVREQPQRERERLHDLPDDLNRGHDERHGHRPEPRHAWRHEHDRDRKSTRLNSSHMSISYAVFCLKKKKKLESGFYSSVKDNNQKWRVRV